MGSPIDEKLVRHVALLSRLAVSDEEVTRFASELSAIVAYMDQLNPVNTEGVEPTAHVLAVRNAVRDDVIVPSPGPEAALANAPQRDGTFFKVPKVLEQDSA